MASAYSYFINAIARHPHTRLACKLRDKWWGMSIVINNNVYLKYVKYILNYQLIATKYMLNWWYSLVTHGRQGQRLFYKKKKWARIYLSGVPLGVIFLLYTLLFWIMNNFLNILSNLNKFFESCLWSVFNLIWLQTYRHKSPYNILNFPCHAMCIIHFW